MLGLQPQDLLAAQAGKDGGQDDSPVPLSHHGIGENVQEALQLLQLQATGDRRAGLGYFTSAAGLVATRPIRRAKS